MLRERPKLHAARITLGAFGPLILGATVQLGAVVVITTTFYVLAQHQILTPKWPFTLCEPGSSCHSATLLVRLSYLLTAIGVALTDNRLITRTMLWARHVSRMALPNEPEFSAEAVAVQLSIVAIACIVEELDFPSQLAVTLGRWIGGLWLGAVLWPAMLSVLAAAIGSLIHAFYLSMQPISVDHS